MKRLIAIAVGIAATSALAQATGSAAHPNQGFFRPSDLAVPREPAAPPVPASLQLQRAATDLLEKTRELQEIRSEEREMDRIERQMDRIEHENERVQYSGPLAGAFDGLTDDRDR